MKRKLWLLQLPIIAFFISCFLIAELGGQGELKSVFLREKFFPVLTRASNVFTDLKFQMRGSRPVQNKIVVVEIDSPSLERIGRWPWHRDMTAYLLEKIYG